MLDVKRLTLLREVSIHGGLTNAAEVLGISVSSISQQLSRLQEDVGILLLEPAGRSVRLTPDADRLVAYTERVLEVLEEAEAELLRTQGELSGVVRLAAFHTFGTRMLVSTLRHLREIAPSLLLEFVQVDPEEAIRELSARRVDMAVADEYPGAPLPPSPGLVRVDLGQDPIALYLPSQVPSEALTPERAVDTLARLPWAMEPRNTSAFHWARGVCRQVGFEPNVVFESPSLDFHRRLVASGEAVAFLTRMIAKDLPGRVTDIPGLPPGLHRSFLMLVRRGTERAPEIMACRRAIEAAYRDLGLRADP